MPLDWKWEPARDNIPRWVRHWSVLILGVGRHSAGEPPPHQVGNSKANAATTGRFKYVVRPGTEG